MVDLDVKDDQRVSEVNSILQELRNAAVTFDNFKRYFDKVEDAERIIKANVQNLKYEYSQINEEVSQSVKSSSNKSMLDRGFVKIDDYNKVSRMNKILSEVVSWKTYQNEIFKVIYVKLGQVLEDTKGMEIQRDAIQQMDKMQDNNQKLFKDNFSMMSRMFLSVVNGQIQTSQEKFMKLIMAIYREFQKNNVENTKMLIRILESTENVDAETKDRIVKDFEKSVSKNDFLENFEKDVKDVQDKTDEELSRVKDDSQKEATDNFEEYFKELEESDDGEDVKNNKPGKRGPGRPPKNSKVESKDDIDSKFEDF